jgi:hypothetical protein
MKARIYKPAKTAMQSGSRNTLQWILDYEPNSSKLIDPLMGWTGTADTLGQIRMRFDSLEDAKSYADARGIAYEVAKPHAKKRRIQAYADNFK